VTSFSTKQLEMPSHLVFAPNGTLYVTDARYHVIHSIDKNGKVSVFAGGKNQHGNVLGSVAQARFFFPFGIAYHKKYLYVSDRLNHCIKRIRVVK